MSLRRFFRFRIISLLVLTTIVSAGLAWYVQPKRVKVGATFLVRSQPPTLLHALDGPPNPTSPEEWAVYRATILAMVDNYSLSTAALANPALATNNVLKGADDPISWLQKNVEAEFNGESECLIISIQGREEQTADLIAIINAVADAFHEQVARRERRERVGTRESLNLTSMKLNEEIRQKMAERNRYSEDVNIEDREDSPELAILQAEIDMLLKMASELGLEVERWDVELQADSRIRRMSPAAVLPE